MNVCCVYNKKMNEVLEKEKYIALIYQFSHRIDIDSISKKEEYWGKKF